MPRGPPPFEPKAGFRWRKVIWGPPDAVVSVLCSYCSAVMRDEEVPLMLFQNDGSCAKFCEDCQRRWWGLETFSDPDEGE
jgi:hypothetical protein